MAGRSTHGPYGRKGAAVRLVFLAVALATWVLTLGGRLRAPGTVVLCYHGVRPGQGARFSRQMRAIRGRAVALREAGRSDRGRTVAVTFDDAFACLIENALPVLRENDVPATVYAVTGCLGRTPTWAIDPAHPEAALVTMTPDELAGIDADPLITLGSHTRTHPVLPALDRTERARELEESRCFLESLLGHAVVDLAYPHGAHDGPTDEDARAAGYERVVTLDAGIVPCAPGMLIGRFSMDPDAWPIEFRLTIDGAYTGVIALRRALRRLLPRRAHAPQPAQKEIAA